MRNVLNKNMWIIILLIMIVMTGCELEKYEIGEVIDDNYYNKQNQHHNLQALLYAEAQAARYSFPRPRPAGKCQ